MKLLHSALQEEVPNLIKNSVQLSFIGDLSQFDKDLIDQKIKKAKTDAEPIPSEAKGLHNRFEAANLISIYSSVNKEKFPRN